MGDSEPAQPRAIFEGESWSDGLRQKADVLCTEHLNALNLNWLNAQAMTEKLERAFTDLIKSAIAEGKDFIDHISVKCPNKKCTFWLWIKKKPYEPFWEGKCECGQTLSILLVEKKKHEGSETGG